MTEIPLTVIATWSTRWPPPDGPYLVTIDLALMPYGATTRIDASRVTVSSAAAPVSTKSLHDVPVWTLVQTAIQDNKDVIDAFWDALSAGPTLGYWDGDSETFTTTPPPGWEDHKTHAISESKDHTSVTWRLDDPTARPGGSTGRPKKLTDDLLREIRQLHREAISRNKSQPRQYVINKLRERHGEISTRTASRWIKAARDAETKEQPNG